MNAVSIDRYLRALTSVARSTDDLVGLQYLHNVSVRDSMLDEE